MTLTLEIGVTQLRYVTEIQKLYAAKAIRYNVNIAYKAFSCSTN